MSGKLVRYWLFKWLDKKRGWGEVTFIDMPLKKAKALWLIGHEHVGSVQIYKMVESGKVKP